MLGQTLIRFIGASTRLAIVASCFVVLRKHPPQLSTGGVHSNLDLIARILEGRVGRTFRRRVRSLRKS